jgi:hypothetical protein
LNEFLDTRGNSRSALTIRNCPHLDGVAQQVIALALKQFSQPAELINQQPLASLLDVRDGGARKPEVKADLGLGYFEGFPTSLKRGTERLVKFVGLDHRSSCWRLRAHQQASLGATDVNQVNIARTE